MQASRAFTLLEVMVVLAIIGGLMALVSLSGSDRQIEDQTRRTAQQVSALFNAYRQEAVFQNIDLGVAFTEDRMQVLSLQDIRKQEFRADKSREELDALAKNPWQAYQGSLKPEFILEDSIRIVLKVEGRELDLNQKPKDKDEGPKPAILFLSSDEYTPFELTFTHNNDESFAIMVSGDGFGLPLLEVDRFED